MRSVLALLDWRIAPRGNRSNAVFVASERRHDSQNRGDDMSAATIEYSGAVRLTRAVAVALSLAVGGAAPPGSVHAQAPSAAAPWNARQLADLVSSIGSIMSGEPAW